MRASTKRLARCSAVTVALLALPAVAQAQGSSAVAEALFQDARRLMKESKYAEACPKLQQSQKLEPKLGTLLNLALCHEQEGRVATAWAEFTTAAAQAVHQDRKRRKVFADQHLAALQPRLSYLTVSHAGKTLQLKVTLDHDDFDTSALGTPLPVDPGLHLVAAEAPGKQRWSKSIDVPPGPVQLRIEIPALQDAPVAEPAPVPTTAPALAPTASPDADAGATTSEGGISPLVWIGFGVAGAGLIVGGVTGGMTLSTASDIDAACPDGNCPPEQQDNLDKAGMLANVSNVSFVLAGIGAGIGVVGLFLSGDDEDTAAFTPVIGPIAAGLRGRF